VASTSVVVELAPAAEVVADEVAAVLVVCRSVMTGAATFNGASGLSLT
jgi:hypothetical protein